MKIVVFVAHLAAFQPSSFEPMAKHVPIGRARKLTVANGSKFDPIHNAFAVLETQGAWIAKLKELIQEHGRSAVENWQCEQDKHKHHLIHLVVARNFSEVLKVMVSELGFDLNVPRSSDKCTPLHLAIWFRRPYY